MKPNVFFTSDWHIGHEKVLEYDKRPFNNLGHMHESLITRYNATVPENGICYFLGDMGLASNKERMTSIINRLNGKKILILGNHDKGPNAMLECGFNIVLNAAMITIGDNLITMSHCPLRGVWREDCSKMKRYDQEENWHGEKRHTKFSIADWGQFHLHGHIHSGPHNEKKTIEGKQMDVGVAAHNFTPVSYSYIESWISRYKNNSSNYKEE